MGQSVSTPKTNVNRRNNSNIEMGKPYTGPTMRNVTAPPNTSIPISELREVRVNTNNNSSLSMSGGGKRKSTRSRKSKKSRKAKKTRGRK